MSSPSLEDHFHELRSLRGEDAESRLAEIARSDPAGAAELRSLLRAASRAEDFLRPPPARESLPEQLGRYTVERELGRGSWGVVYLARDPDLGRPVAIKLLRQSRVRDELTSEARALASVVHPNVAQVHALERFPTDGGDLRLGLVMEYVPGVTLAEELRRGRLELIAAIDRGRQIAAALEAAHEKGVVHLDLKPQNVRVTPEGWVKVLDFGMAALLGDDGRARSRGGTPGYMSPEQERGDAVDPRADLFAFALVLSECLTGVPAYATAAGTAGAPGSPVPRAAPAPVGRLLAECLQEEAARRSVQASEARRVLEDELLRIRARALFDDPQRKPRRRSRSGRSLGNLPQPVTSFVGRDPFLQDLSARIEAPGCFTLVGPGGVGKTRAAIEAVRRSGSRRSGGVWFVDLSALDDDEPIGPALARVVRVPIASGSTGPLEAIARAWSGRRPMLVLDNCEHVLEESARAVAFLRERVPELTVVATSLAPLGLPEEEVHPVAPLRVAAVDDRPAEAVALFLARARSRHPSFSPRPSDLEMIAAIAHHLDGLPLAVELAASQVRNRSLEEIHDRIAGGGALGFGWRGGPDRHRSLSDLVAWSCRRLPEEGRRILARLSIFRGGFTLASAEDVVSGDTVDRYRVGDHIAHLVEFSLVQMEERRDHPQLRFDSRETVLSPRTAPADVSPEQPARYRLLETIRSFADGQLGATERSALTERFLAHALELSAPRVEETVPSGVWYVRRIERDYDNLAHALSLALGLERVETAAVLVDRLSRYWTRAGTWRFGLARLEQVIALRRPELPVACDAPLVSHTARMAVQCGYPERARELLGEAVTLSEQVEDPRVRAELFITLGSVHWFLTDTAGAEELFLRAETLARAHDDRSSLAACLHNRAAIRNIQGRHDDATPLHEELLAVCRQIDDPPTAAKALLNLSRQALQLERVEESESLCAEAEAILRDHPDPLDVALFHHHLGDIRRVQRRWSEAWDELLRSVRLRLRIGSRPGASSAILSLASVATEGFGERLGLEIAAGVLHLFESGQVLAHPGQIAHVRSTLDAKLANLDPGERAAIRAGAIGLDLEDLLARAEARGKERRR